MFTDLFGFPLPEPKAFVLKQKRPTQRSFLAKQEAKRKKALRHLEQSNNLMLFDEVLAFLQQPLFLDRAFINRMKSDRYGVIPAEEEYAETYGINPDIPYEAWGMAWIEDCHGLAWSVEGIRFLQNQLFWESMEEMELNHNELEKWSVLKWIMAPAIVKQYVFDWRLGKSHCLVTHERDHPFSFANCCMAASIDADVVREGFQRLLPANVVKSVIALRTY